jgi:hypothetical protein
MVYVTRELEKREVRITNKRGKIRKPLNRSTRFRTGDTLRLDKQITRWVTDSLIEHHDAYEYLKNR